jgi:hypothetical protein
MVREGIRSDEKQMRPAPRQFLACRSRHRCTLECNMENMFAQAPILPDVHIVFLLAILLVDGTPCKLDLSALSSTCTEMRISA